MRRLDDSDMTDADDVAGVKVTAVFVDYINISSRVVSLEVCALYLSSNPDTSMTWISGERVREREV